MTCYLRCNNCDVFYKESVKHKCIKVREMKLKDLKELLRSVTGINPQVLVGFNGLFIQSDNVFLHVKDNFEMHQGLHNLTSLGNDKPIVGTQVMQWSLFPKVVEFDTIRINWKSELSSLQLSMESIKVLWYLLHVYEIESMIKLTVNDDFAEFKCDKFEIIMRVIAT